MPWIRYFVLAALPWTLAWGAPAAPPPLQPSPAAREIPHENLTLRGRVVWLGEVLERRQQIVLPNSSARNVLVLEGDDGRLTPLIEDVRGRSFRSDERLRNTPVELLVRKYQNSPLVQVIRIFALPGDERYELDYWCDICAIVMFELKECDCCQGPIELRRRPSPAGEPLR